MSEFENEEKLKARLEAKFGGAISDMTIQRKDRLWFEIKPEQLVELAAFMKTGMGFNHMATITGVDEGEKLGAFYHLTDQSAIITVRVKTPKTDPHLPTITAVFPGSEPYERELMDMFGIKMDGLKPGRRYPLPDDFPTDQYPLRKDWKTADAYPETKTASAAEAK